MNINKSARELLDRYLLAVKRELTGKDRDDITAEIESYLFDILEERFPKEKEITNKQMEEVLKEMGSPRKVAAQYSPQRYLIGPRLFPVYFLILKIVVAVVIGALALSTIITAVLGETTISWLTGLEFIGTIWSAVLSTAGAITLTFAIIERVSEGKDIKELDELEELKIPDLPQLPAEEKQPGKIGISFEIVLGIIGIAFFTYVQNTDAFVPFFLYPGSKVQMVQLFTDNFLQFIPVIIALAGLDLTRNITILMQGHHSSLTNWWEICTKAANVVMLGLMIKALPIITLEGFQTIFDNESFIQLEPLANTGIGIAMGLGIFGSIVDIIRKVIREIRNPAF
jgi:hypothetical protein